MKPNYRQQFIDVSIQARLAAIAGLKPEPRHASAEAVRLQEESARKLAELRERTPQVEHLPHPGQARQGGCEQGECGEPWHEEPLERAKEQD